MNKTKLLCYLSHKEWFWRQIFCDFYVAKHNLHCLRLKTDLQPETLVRHCNSTDEIDELWDLADYVDRNEDDLYQIIGYCRYYRPIPWQYDFVTLIMKILDMQQPSYLTIFTVTDAYCAALLSEEIDLEGLVQTLDAKYEYLFASVSEKTNLLKRNFSLNLECMCSCYRDYGCSAGLNYRELIERYVGKIGVSGLIKALKNSRTPETKLSPEERACLGFSYYSPYFCYENSVQSEIMPGDSLFVCVENRLVKEAAYREALQKAISESKDEDEDEQDDLKEELEATHCMSFIDQQELSLIDVQYGEVPYAHVYVQKLAHDSLNSSLPDFIRYSKGFLYTVEFVDDIKSLPFVHHFVEHIESIKLEITDLVKKGLKNGGWNAEINERYEELQQDLAVCYCVFM